MVEIRDYRVKDAQAIDALAVKAFEQYQNNFEDWPGLAAKLRTFSSQADVVEIIVATDNDQVVGAVGYMPPHVDKAEFYPANTPVMRLLVVDPSFRGKGLGKQLAVACINRAVRDGCDTMALHTSQIMTVALPMYKRMGFRRISNAPDIHGVKYGVYQLDLRGYETI